MGIRKHKKDGGEVVYNTDVRLTRDPSQGESFRTRTMGKKWIETQSSIQNERRFHFAKAKRHTIKDLIERFIIKWLHHFRHRVVRLADSLEWRENKLGAPVAVKTYFQRKLDMLC